jgi:hypothetical protein
LKTRTKFMEINLYPKEDGTDVFFEMVGNFAE